MEGAMPSIYAGDDIMILFKEDWEDYPSAIPDYNTSNESFLELAAVYKAMGYSNNNFHLALMQPGLVGVDPYSENLNTAQKEMIRLEAEYNPWYFLRELMLIPPVASMHPIRFIANRANISLVWSFLNHIDYILIQPRQTGKSVSTDSLTTWLYLFSMRKSTMLLLTKDDSLRSDNVARLRNMRMYLPPWLIVDDKTDANNTLMVTYNTRGNRYRTAVGQNSEDAALKTGRGATVPVIHCDEGPFISFIDITLAAALSATNAARAEAKKFGFPYGNIFTTTAGKLDSRSGKYFYEEVLAPAAPWTEAYLDLSGPTELRDVVLKSGSGRAASIAGIFNHRQLGYSDDWLYEKMAEAKSHGDAANRDYFNGWTSGGLSSPLPNSVTAAILKSEMDPTYVDIAKSGYILKWYIPEFNIANFMRENHIAIGVDTSDAIGRDGIAITFVNQANMEVIAAACVNETWLPFVAVWLADMMVKYKKTTLVIEDKSSAQTFIDTAMIKLIGAGEDPLARIFNRLYQEPEKYPKQMELLRLTPPARRNVEFYRQFRKYFGFMTTGDSRNHLYSEVLLNAAKTAGSMVRDRTLSGEIRKLEMRNGRIDHSAKGHDDMVISWLIANWFFFHAKNLDFYGVDINKFNVRIGKDGEVASPDDIVAKAKQESVKLQIETAMEKLKNTDSIHLLMALDAEIRNLSKRLIDSDDVVTIDGLVRDAKLERMRRLNEKRKLNRR